MVFEKSLNTGYLSSNRIDLSLGVSNQDLRDLNMLIDVSCEEKLTRGRYAIHV